MPAHGGEKADEEAGAIASVRYKRAKAKALKAGPARNSCHLNSKFDSRSRTNKHSTMNSIETKMDNKRHSR